MRSIKIKILNYDPTDKFSFGAFLLSILSKHYDVKFSDKPDYLFYTESTPEHLAYNCVKIFFTGENVSPDFNFCDYAIGFDYLRFQDRYYRLPLYLITQFYSDKEIALMPDPADFTVHAPFTRDDLARKTGFCSFVYSNYMGDGAREEFFRKLNAYKKVSSGGKYLNNIGGPVENKLDFELSHKFSIAFENSSRSGYTTEKLVNSLVARTIPIYWGNPDIGLEFNESRFINCHAYANFDEVIERIKEIDADDELYLKIINEPIASTYDFKEALSGFEKFLSHILDQDVSVARRRSINPARERSMMRSARIVAMVEKLSAQVKRSVALLYTPFKKFGFMERIKHKILKR